MKNSYTDIIIKTLIKKIGKTIKSQEIESLQKEIMGSSFNTNKFYKLMHALKNRGYLIEIKSGLYSISYPEAHHNTQELKTNYYWPLLHGAIKQYKKAYIGGKKGLEIYLNNYDIDEHIDIRHNDSSHQKITIIEGHRAQLRSSAFNHHRLSSTSIHNTIYDHGNKIAIDGKYFIIGSPETCLLETLYYSTKSSGTYEIELAKKIVKKYKNQINYDLITLIISAGKYHTSLNRLYEIAKQIDSTIAQRLFQIIKLVGFRIKV